MALQAERFGPCRELQAAHPSLNRMKGFLPGRSAKTSITLPFRGKPRFVDLPRVSTQHREMSLKVLFPTQIYTAACLNPRSKLFAELIEEAALLAEKDRPGRDWSKSNYRRGYTSYGSLDQLHRFSSSFNDLKLVIDPHIPKFLKALGLQVPVREIQLSRMWVNVMGEGCSHPMHLHPLSVISGTFYLQTPKDGSAIRFEDPRMDQFMARPLAKAASGQSSAYHHAHKPTAGEVVLFESWLKHEVPESSSKQKRISVSFNYDWMNA